MKLNTFLKRISENITLAHNIIPLGDYITGNEENNKIVFIGHCKDCCRIVTEIEDFDSTFGICDHCLTIKETEEIQERD